MRPKDQTDPTGGYFVFADQLMRRRTKNTNFGGIFMPVSLEYVYKLPRKQSDLQ